MRCKFSGLCAVPNAMFRAEVLSLKAFKNTGREDFIQQIGHPQVKASRQQDRNSEQRLETQYRLMVRLTRD